MMKKSLAILSAVLVAFASHGTVLVYEGFHPADYGNVSASGNVQANTTFTAGHTIGFSTSGWSGMSGTQVRIFGENFGLALPQTMTDAGFTAIGGSIGLNPSNNNAGMRAMNHALASKVLNLTDGTLHVRMLVNLESAAAARLTARSTLVGNDGNYYACGFCIAPSGNDYHLLTHTRSSIAFLLWRNSDNQYVLSFGHTTAAEATAAFYPLVTGITLGETYVCYAEIQIDAGESGNEIVRAGAVAASDFTGAVPWAALGGASDSIETQLISASAYPTVMAVAGPYGTNGGKFRADEIVVGTARGDILPIGGVFAVSSTGMPTVGMNAFSTDWILVADEGVTAGAGLVWSTDETFATATTNSLGTGLAAGTRTASLSSLEPATTYWWKIYADNGTDVAETATASFTTLGAPILGIAAATVTGETAAFSVALTEAALRNTLNTSVSVFYGTDGETWTELPLGSTSVAETFSGTAGNLGFGVTYQWFARATATMQGGRILVTDSATNTFTTLYAGDMYVAAASANPVIPYSTPETAAANIPTALALATDGATIHVAPGLYPITVPLTISNSIRILGDEPDPSLVVVSNKTGAGYKNGNQRVFYLDNAGAFVANLTMQKGQSWGSSGSSFYISASGGTVSNCVVEAGATTGNSAFSAGAVLNAGRVTHTVFRKCKIGSNSTSDSNGSYRAAVLHIKGDAVAENCLLVDNTQAAEKSLTLIRIEGNATLRNCTVVDSGLGNTNAYCNVFTPIYISSANATVQNVVVAGITNQVDGALCRPAWGQPARFLNGATDADISELGFPEGTVTGTAASFFKDYAHGDYRPAPGGPLQNAGVNYTPMASVDLAGKPRLVEASVDIGAYESPPSAMVIMLK